MVCIKAKLDTIYFRNFLYILKNRDRPQYHFSVYWLKFLMGREHLENFNIIPSGDDRDRPAFYENMIKSVNNMKILYRNWLENYKTISTQKINKINNELNISTEKKTDMINKIRSHIKKYEVSHLKAGTFLTSKEIYNFYLKKIAEKPRFGTLSSEEYSTVFKDLHKIEKCSNLRSLNYKIIFDGLPCNKKFKNRYGKICYLCRKETIISLDTLKYKLNVSENDHRIFSYYMSSVWRVRNLLKHTNENLDGTSIFKKIFSKWLISQTAI